MTPVAVIVSVEGAAAAPTMEAVERQTVAPERVVMAERLGEVPASEWLWLIDSGVLPEPPALERLISASQRGDYALLASRVLTPDGTLDPSSTPVPEVHRVDRVLAALEQRAVALRMARSGSLLVRAEALARGHLDRDLEWTARLLADRPGILEPASVAVRVAGERPTRLSDGLRLLAALEGRERLWFAAHLAEQAVAHGRRG